MGATVLAAIFLLLFFGLLLGAIFGMPKTRTFTSGSSYNRTTEEKRNYARFWVMAGAILFLILAPITFISAGFQSVPTKSVGVLTSYGRVQGTPYGPGSHWMVPWKTLNIVTDTIQSDSFFQSYGNNADTYSNSGAQGYCITVRLGGSQEGCADIQLQTQTDESAIPALFANYSSYGPNLTQDVDRYVVKRDLTTVLNRVLGDYSPVMDVSQQLAACDLHKAATCQANVTSQFSQFDTTLLHSLQDVLGNQVKVIDVNLQYIHYNQTTEDALTKIQDSYTATAQAVQQEQTNAAISAANKALVSSTGTLTPVQLEQQCLAIVQTAIKEGYQLPLTWGNCISPSSTSGVIVNSGK